MKCGKVVSNKESWISLISLCLLGIGIMYLISEGDGIRFIFFMSFGGFIYLHQKRYGSYIGELSKGRKLKDIEEE